MASSRLQILADHLRASSTESSTPQDGAATYQVTEEPLGTTRHLRIVGIGAGMSGMNMIRTLQLHLTNYEHVVYEKNPVIGGTWYENRYPGCKCDVPSHNYQFSWRTNPHWKGFFSSATEIQAYLCQVCEEENMSGSIMVNHQVERAEWDELAGLWNLKVRNLQKGSVFDDRCDFLLDSGGILNNWQWPRIPGLDDFQGELIHSANWPENFIYAGKTVALIGNGSSGVQILPEVQKEAKHLVHFVRDPTWVVPSRLQAAAQHGILDEIELDGDENFSAAQIRKFESQPEYYKKFIKAVEEIVNGNFPITLKDTEYAATIETAARKFMTDALNGNETLCKAIIPDFPLGCRRLTPAIEYLTALQRPNVRVVTNPIAKVVAEGLETLDGEVIKVDAIICATGFNVSFCPRFPIIGRQGNLQDRWTREVPKSYMSCAIPDFPNYFTFLGPSAPIGHGSVFTITEHIARYLTRLIKKCQVENIKAVCPTWAATDELFEHTQAFMPRTAWTGNCVSWFKNGTADGPVIALHPGSRIHFFHMLEGFRGEDWEYTYRNTHNRFQYLGNGFSTREDGDQDSTWYLDDPDAL